MFVYVFKYQQWQLGLYFQSLVQPLLQRHEALPMVATQPGDCRTHLPWLPSVTGILVKGSEWNISQGAQTISICVFRCNKINSLINRPNLWWMQEYLHLIYLSVKNFWHERAQIVCMYCSVITLLVIFFENWVDTLEARVTSFVKTVCKGDSILNCSHSSWNREYIFFSISDMVHS